MDIGAVGDPKAPLSVRGESRGGTIPLGFGEKIADAVIFRGDTSAEENEERLFPGACWIER